MDKKLLNSLKENLDKMSSISLTRINGGTLKVEYNVNDRIPLDMTSNNMNKIRYNKDMKVLHFYTDISIDTLMDNIELLIDNNINFNINNNKSTRDIRIHYGDYSDIVDCFIEFINKDNILERKDYSGYLDFTKK